MEKKALQLASVASMIDQFTIPNIRILISLGYKVDVVADFTNPGNITIERANVLKNRLADMGVRVFDVAIPRSLNPEAISKSYKKVKALIEEEHYNLVHCHSPIGGVIARQASKGLRKTGLKVIYTAHGFHFYDGAPIKNWLLFYPIEKHYSRYTDVLITINKEDYKRATERFKANKIVYVPGVGVDTEKFKPDETRREKIRAELGLNDNQIMLLSVGELNENKNHESVIKALSGTNVTYVVVGKGDLNEHLNSIAKEFSVDLRLVGFQNDVVSFYNAADIYVLPSIREGLNVSLMEAMACGLPCIVSSIRGNIDLINDGNMIFDPRNINDIRNKIIGLINESSRFIIGKHNVDKISKNNISVIENIMKKIYMDY